MKGFRRISKVGFLVLFLLFCLAVLRYKSFSQFDAYEVALKEHQRYEGDDEIGHMTMKLTNSRGEERVRKLIRCKRRVNDLDEVLMRFTAPADIRGTSLLTLERNDTDDIQFLYMPSMKKVRRISTSDKSQRFVGSDFNYEDLRRFKLDNFTYYPLGEEKFMDYDCYVYEAIPKTEEASVYGKIVHWIRKDNYFRPKVDYYDKKMRLFKTGYATVIENIQGVWTGVEVVMKDLEANHTTIIKREWVKYNNGVPDDVFTVRSLESEEFYGE